MPYNPTQIYLLRWSRGVRSSSSSFTKNNIWCIWNFNYQMRREEIKDSFRVVHVYTALFGGVYGGSRKYLPDGVGQEMWQINHDFLPNFYKKKTLKIYFEIPKGETFEHTFWKKKNLSCFLTLYLKHLIIRAGSNSDDSNLCINFRVFFCPRN